MAFGNGAISNCPLPFITYALFTPQPPLAEPPHPRRSQPISQTTKYLGKKEKVEGERYGHPHFSMIDWHVYGTTVLDFDPGQNSR